MYFANPWGLLALAAIPAIVVIHLYHRRFPPLVVAGLHLWSSEVKQQLPGRRRERLPITASLLFELFAALLLSLILSRPNFGDFDRVVHLVAILDDSASMSAQPPDEKESFRDAAIAELKARVKSLPRGSVVTLIKTGMRPTMLADPAVPWSDAEPALAAWKPAAPRHAFEPAWDLGLQLVEKDGELLFLTDKLPGENESPERMETISVGRRLDNIAISAARWTYDSATAKGRVFLRVQNHGRQPITFEVRGTSGEQAVFRKDVSLPSGGASSFEAEVPGALQRLTVELVAPNDGLALDNRVDLVEPRVRTVTVALGLPKDESARLLERVLRALPDVQLGDASSAHLAIIPARSLSSGSIAESTATCWLLGVGPLDPSEESRKTAKDLAGPYLVEKRNPLMEGIVLGGVIWGGVQPAPFEVTPLISAGSTPLFARLNGTRTPAYLLNIDLARSNLGESPDWPILLSNFVELRRDDLPGLQRWNYHLGEDVRFRLFEGDKDPAGTNAPLTVVHGKQTKPLSRANFVEIPALEQPGEYAVLAGNMTVARFAVNFHDADESDLRTLAPGTRAPTKTAVTSHIELDHPNSWPILLGLFAILIAVIGDWYVLGRNGEFRIQNPEN